MTVLPEGSLERGVYLFEGDVGEELSPGSLIAPLIGRIIPEADLVAETGAPPLTVLAGLGEDVELPEAAVRVEDLVVAGSPEDVEAVRLSIAGASPPQGALAILDTLTAPVAWAGLLPGCEAGTSVKATSGSFAVALSGGSVEIIVEGPAAMELSAVVGDRLASEGPADSPGKPWATILTEPSIRAAGVRLTIRAVPVDLPGGFLRQLLDTRGLSFLRPAAC